MIEIKTFTTPTLAITLADNDEATGAEILAAADEVIFTLSDGTIDIDKVPTIDGATCYATFTEEETGSLGVGRLEAELTIKMGSKVIKTKTMKTKISEAVRDRVID